MVTHSMYSSVVKRVVVGTKQGNTEEIEGDTQGRCVGSVRDGSPKGEDHGVG